MQCLASSQHCLGLIYDNTIGFVGRRSFPSWPKKSGLQWGHPNTQTQNTDHCECTKRPV